MLFCKKISPPTSDDDHYHQWFEDTIDTNTLEPNTLYTWVDTTTHDQQGNQETHTDSEKNCATNRLYHMVSRDILAGVTNSTAKSLQIL